MRNKISEEIDIAKCESKLCHQPNVFEVLRIRRFVLIKACISCDF